MCASVSGLGGYSSLLGFFPSILAWTSEFLSVFVYVHVTIYVEIVCVFRAFRSTQAWVTVMFYVLVSVLFHRLLWSDLGLLGFALRDWFACSYCFRLADARMATCAWAAIAPPPLLSSLRERPGCPQCFRLRYASTATCAYDGYLCPPGFPFETGLGVRRAFGIAFTTLGRLSDSSFSGMFQVSLFR